MALNNHEGIGEVLDALGSTGRIESFDFLVEGREPKEIPDQMEISRSGLQHHLDKFREVGLIYKNEDNDYEVTAFGTAVHDWLQEFDNKYEDVAHEGITQQFEQEFEERVGGLNSPEGRKILAELRKKAKDDE